MSGFHRPGIVILSLFSLLAGTCSQVSAEGTNAPGRKPAALIISPLTGWVQNENLRSGQTDNSPEYGLFAMYATPRFVINNTVFYTDVNNSEVWGDIASLSLYGDPKSRLTWYLGGSYVWHQIKPEDVNMTITITEPLGKVGFLWRIPSKHLSINPYIGYGVETVLTEGSVSTPGGTFKFKDKDRSDLAVYGIMAYWRWRMFHIDAKYYLSQDLDHNTLNNTFRLWGSVMFSERTGILTRFEYTEQNTTKDTSILFGPVFVF